VGLKARFVVTGKKIVLMAVALLLAVGAGGAAIVWSLVQVPDFYQQALAEPPDPVAQQQAAKSFVARTVQLVDDIKHFDTWSQEFDGRQVNAWLANELHSKYADLVPPGIRDPRVGFDDQFVLVGFYYETEQWQGVVSLRLRPWVPEPNTLAIEIASIRAGLVPIPLDSVLEELSNQIQTDGWRAEWSQLDGNDVLLVHFDSGAEDQPVLESVQVVGEMVRISGSRAQHSRQPRDGMPRESESTFNVSQASGQSTVK
jgi:hypothetical protein